MRPSSGPGFYGCIFHSFSVRPPYSKRGIALSSSDSPSFVYPTICLFSDSHEFFRALTAQRADLGRRILGMHIAADGALPARADIGAKRAHGGRFAVLMLVAAYRAFPRLLFRGLILDQREILFPVTAQRANVIIGHFITLVHIAAHRAFPFLASARLGGSSRKSSLGCLHSGQT